MKPSPERFAFILMQNLLGASSADIAKLINATKDEVEILLASEFYQKEKARAFEVFRFNATRNAADELAFAAMDAAKFLRNVPNNYSYKAAIRLRAAMDILDRIPQTSKTLRSFSLDANLKDLTDAQRERLENTAKAISDPNTIEGEIEAPPFEHKESSADVQFRENLRSLINV